MKEKIERLGILCRKGSSKGLTKEENKEFKKLEKEISGVLLSNENIFDAHIDSFREAVGSLLKFGFDFTK